MTYSQQLPPTYWGWKNTVSLSGGRTSAYMLKLLLDKHGDTLRNDWVVEFCNTGKEFDQTLDFVHKIETRWNVPVVWLEYTRVPAVEINPLIYKHKVARQTIRNEAAMGLKSHWFRRTDYFHAKRWNDNDTPFDELLLWANVLPNVRTRSCSVQMKVRTMMRYLFSIGVTTWRDHIGIRGDESHRALEIKANAPKYTKPQFPLIEAGVTEAEVMRFWKQESDFDLELESHEGNCNQCFLKAIWKLKRIMREYPETTPWWKEQEAVFAAKPEITGDGKMFRKGRAYADVEAAAWQEMEATDEQDIPCSCVEKSYAACDAGEAAE